MEPINREFIAKVWPDCLTVGAEYGMDPVLIAAVASYETGFGLDSTILAAGATNNFFGLKALPEVEDLHAIGWAMVPTTEFENGQRVPVKDKFNSYATFADSARAWCEWVLGKSGLSKYADPPMPKDDAKAFAHELERRGYSTEEEGARNEDGTDTRGYAYQITNMMDRIRAQYPPAASAPIIGGPSPADVAEALRLARQLMAFINDETHPRGFPLAIIRPARACRDALKAIAPKGK